MRFVQLALEVVSRLALLFFTLLISIILGTFVVSLFLPTFSKTLTIIAVVVAAFTVFASLYALFVSLDDDEKLWDFVPNILQKSKK